MTYDSESDDTLSEEQSSIEEINIYEDSDGEIEIEVD